MAKKIKKETVAEHQDSLVDVLVEALNSAKKGETAIHAQTLSSFDTTTGWISTGSTLLDMAISNKRSGGYPMGRIIEIMGLEGTGKSLLAAHAIAETQKQGGIGVFIDTEHAVNGEFFEVLGVDRSKMLYVSAESIEECFEAITRIMSIVKSTEDPKHRKPVTMVLDSIAGASTKPELSADFDKDGYATQKAIILSKGWRKITNLIGVENVTMIVTNQLRQKLSAMPFQDPWCVDPYTTKIKIRYKS